MFTTIGQAILTGLLLLCVGTASAQETYHKPSSQILEVLSAALTPVALVSPQGDDLLLAEPISYPPIADLAQPMLRLAGLQVNPKNNALHQASYFVALTLLKIGNGAPTKVTLPPGAKITAVQWAPDGTHIAFLNTTDTAVELWVVEVATGQARRVGGIAVNPTMGSPVTWMPDSRTLIVKDIPALRGRPPARPSAPTGPTIQESAGKTADIWTFQDLLKNPHDERQFSYYGASQLTLVEVATDQATLIGTPSLLATISPSPDGQHLLVERVHLPFSYVVPHAYFPRDVEVWDRTGQVLHTLASLPLADAVSTDGVPTGPRSYHWHAAEPATLVWVEALDNGDPKKEVPQRDRILMLTAPFRSPPVELIKTEHRYAGLLWGEQEGVVLVSDYDRVRRWRRTFLLDTTNLHQAPRLLFSRDMRDRYHDPGTPLMRVRPTGHQMVRQQRGRIYLSGAGATSEGDRPFLDRMDLTTLKADRLFQSDTVSYETVVALLDDEARQFVTRRESPSAAPNYVVHGSHGSRRILTQFADPTPALRGITKQVVTYKRADGIPLAFTLYLPADYQPGSRLPTVLWAYPREHQEPDTAGQVAGSTQRFTTLLGPSPLFYLLHGYAVLDNATIPVVGDFHTVNDTYVEQIVMGAKAAIEQATAMGVTDPNRVGVGGHSYGALMAANLLAHSNLFRAGVARSGAYNRTLTPFGFQSERRTLWQARDSYIRMSPLIYANQIDEPLLLIHGEADNNPGTLPVQSERLYQAVRGNGGTVRLVMLPHEAHNYRARESVEHTLDEMITWFDRYVKDASPRQGSKHSSP